MKRSIAWLIIFALCLSLAACGGGETAHDSSAQKAEEILLSEKWLAVPSNGATTYQFVPGGVAYVSGNDALFSVEWKLDGSYVIITQTLMGNENKASFSLMEVDGTYRLQSNTSDNYFVREADFEAEKAAAGIQETEAVKVLAYFEECASLPTPDSCVDVRYSGKSTSSSNGVTTKIEYKYTFNNSAVLSEYISLLESQGFSAESTSDQEYSVIENKYIIANVKLEGSLLLVSIVPTENRVMSASNAVTISLGETIVTPDYEFTLNNVELTYELKPSNTSSVYTSYPAESGKVYIHIDGSYFNTSKRDVCIRDLFVPTADYNNGYTYTGFVVVDDGDNSFDWVSSYVVCTPLETCHYHGLIECPEAVDNSTAPLYVTFTLADGVTYRYDIR